MCPSDLSISDESKHPAKCDAAACQRRSSARLPRQLRRPSYTQSRPQRAPNGLRIAAILALVQFREHPYTSPSPSLQFSPKSPHTARSRPRHPVDRTAPIGASQHQATARSRGRAVLWGGSTTETKKKQMRQVMVCVSSQLRRPSSTVVILTSACIDLSRSPTTARRFLVLAVGIEKT